MSTETQTPRVGGRQARIPLETLIADFRAGMNAAEIAEKYDMGKETVRWRLNQWQPGCLANSKHRKAAKRKAATPPVPPGRPYICADDGRIYRCERVWLRDWAVLSLHNGGMELLVAVDGGHPRRAINGTQAPLILMDPLIGVRIFPDCNGVERTWKAHVVRPKYTEGGFPRRLLPSGVRPATNPKGAMLWANGTDWRKALGHKESRPAANNLSGAVDVCDRISPRAESHPGDAD